MDVSFGPSSSKSATRLARLLKPDGSAAENSLRLPPRQTLKRAHRRKLGLCDLLEDIADSLPKPDQLRCMQAAAILTQELPIHHADEDLGLFPLLRKRCLPEDRFDAIAERLSDEHVDIEASLEEIAATLSAFADQTNDAISGDAFGYALRGIFEGLRRHIAWEEATLMPLVEERLQPSDWHELHQIMVEHRVGARPNALLRDYSVSHLI